jgi:hypothetical protein
MLLIATDTGTIVSFLPSSFSRIAIWSFLLCNSFFSVANCAFLSFVYFPPQDANVIAAKSVMIAICFIVVSLNCYLCLYCYIVFLIVCS